MNKGFIKCPKDPQKIYQRTICEEIFRKGNIRIWCKSCVHFDDKTAIEKPIDQALQATGI